MGKLARLTAEYDAMPCIDDDLGEDDAAAEELDVEALTVADQSLLFPSAQPALAELAERTRSQLMLRRPASQLSNSAMTTASAVTTSCAPASDGPPPSSSVNKRSGAAARHGSMITHASRTTGHSFAGPGHTFGSLARASASGTMPHHAPRGQPTTAVAARLRPTSARSTPSMARLEERESAHTEGGRLDSRRPASARSSARVERSSAATTDFLTFGADAKGSVAYRTARHAAREPKACRAFAFVACCGEDYDGYCCRRHHPDDAVVCCEKHDPAAVAALAKSAMGGRVGAGHGPAFAIGRGGQRHTMLAAAR
uniref:Uncharacterized protein n=1 Tax=Haptolina brevifila TaxID=156173 RepID=A0A7S2DKI2_9EUKA